MSGLHPNHPEWGTEDYRRYAALFNDIGRNALPSGEHFPFSDRAALADYLWTQGWRREVRDEDVTERARAHRDDCPANPCFGNPRPSRCHCAILEQVWPTSPEPAAEPTEEGA